MKYYSVTWDEGGLESLGGGVKESVEDTLAEAKAFANDLRKWHNGEITISECKIVSVLNITPKAN